MGQIKYLREYESAAELASDIRRHLQDEPVLAGPPSAAYRTKKFMRRHRIAVALVTMAAVSLVVGSALWELFYLRYCMAAY